MRSKLITVLLLLCFNIACCFPTDFGANSDSKKCGRVHLTVSPPPETYLELNWIADCSPPDSYRPDFIVLYDQKDLNEKSPLLVKIRAGDYPEGYYRTNISFGRPRLPGNWEYNELLSRVEPGPHCYSFWIAATRGHDIIDTNCLGIRPTWMHDISKQIGTQKIGNLFIPGTHNSGAFDGVTSFLEKYVLNQDRSVWSQLVHGIRYLDFRIGYYGNDEGFFINHANVRLIKVEPLFKQIRKFLQVAPHEIIIIDFHRFPYPSRFNASLHHQFVGGLLDKYLKEFALPPGILQVGRGPTLNEIWAQNKNLIICYKEDNISREYSWLWRFIPQIWANAQNVPDLKRFIGGALKNRASSSLSTPNPLVALMAELTPPAFHFSLNKFNLRKLAHVNRNVTKWFRDEWSRDANIVATDYFLGNDIINIAIDTNLHR